MMTRIPRRLAPGDLIAVTAPSSGVPQHLHTRLEHAINNLKKRGFRVREGECLRSQHKNKSACKVSRAKELMACLTDPDVQAVIPPWGGDLAIELLELMDFELLRKTDPKWFVGFSDLSTLHLPLVTLSGWATLHGPNLMDLGASNPDSTTKAVWDILEAEKRQIIEQCSSEAYQNKENQWGTSGDAPFNLTQRTVWKNLNGVASSVRFKGRMIGGCLEIISRLAGTPFGDIQTFKERYKDEGVILYFENVEMGPCEMTRALFSLRLQGWFNNLNGILIGRSAAPDADDTTKHNYVDALTASLSDLPVTVLYDVDIGHVPPQVSILNGVHATVNFADGRGSITQQL